MFCLSENSLPLLPSHCLSVYFNHCLYTHNHLFHTVVWNIFFLTFWPKCHISLHKKLECSANNYICWIMKVLIHSKTSSLLLKFCEKWESFSYFKLCLCLVIVYVVWFVMKNVNKILHADGSCFICITALGSRKKMNSF